MLKRCDSNSHLVCSEAQSCLRNWSQSGSFACVLCDVISVLAYPWLTTIAQRAGSDPADFVIDTPPRTNRLGPTIRWVAVISEQCVID